MRKAPDRDPLAELLPAILCNQIFKNELQSLAVEGIVGLIVHGGQYTPDTSGEQS